MGTRSIIMTNHIEQFFLMGGYGWYVWAAYGLVAAVLAGLLWNQIRQFSGSSQLPNGR
jgi:heme exporter protein D